MRSFLYFIGKVLRKIIKTLVGVSIFLAEGQIPLSYKKFLTLQSLIDFGWGAGLFDLIISSTFLLFCVPFFELLLNNPHLKLKDIKFTSAIRPRTGEVIPRCQNCINIFGEE